MAAGCGHGRSVVVVRAPTECLAPKVVSARDTEPEGTRRGWKVGVFGAGHVFPIVSNLN